MPYRLTKQIQQLTKQIQQLWPEEARPTGAIEKSSLSSSGLTADREERSGSVTAGETVRNWSTQFVETIGQW